MVWGCCVLLVSLELVRVYMPPPPPPMVSPPLPPCGSWWVLGSPPPPLVHGLWFMGVGFRGLGLGCRVQDFHSGPLVHCGFRV